MDIKHRFSSQRAWRVLGLAAALLVHPAMAQKVVLGGAYNSFDNLYIVATVPADNAANCANLIAAIAAASAPSTIKLPPAIYDCGSTVLNVPTGVTLEGSGKLNTRILGQINLFVVLNTSAEINNLTLENTATNSSQVRTIDLRPGSILSNVDLTSTGTGNSENGAIQISTAGTEETRIRDVRIRVSDAVLVSDAIAVFANSASLTLRNVDILVTGAPDSSGIFIAASSSPTIKIRDSILAASDDAIVGGTPTRHFTFKSCRWCQYWWVENLRQRLYLVR